LHLDLFDDLPLTVSELDAPPLSDIELFLDAYGIYGTYRDYWRPVFEEQFHFRPRKPEHLFRGGEIIDLGAVTVEVISAPGHTPGHLSFFFKEPEILFIGDYDLTWFGPWYGDLHSSIQGTIDSVERLRGIPSKIWLASHETGIFEEEPGDLWDQYLGVIAKRESKLLNLLEKPRTLEDIVNAWIVYGKPREPKIFYEFGERAQIMKHLERLMDQGVVAMDGEKYFINN